MILTLILILTWLGLALLSVINFATANFVFKNYCDLCFLDCLASSFENDYFCNCSFALSVLMAPFIYPCSIIYLIYFFIEFIGEKISNQLSHLAKKFKK